MDDFDAAYDDVTNASYTRTTADQAWNEMLEIARRDIVSFVKRVVAKEEQWDELWIWNFFETIGPRCLEGLIALLGDPDTAVRAYAAYVIWTTPDERSIDPLIHLMADSAPKVRRSAMWSLCSLPFQRSEEAASSFIDDSDEMIRVFLAQDISNFRFVSYLDLLPKLFADPSPKVRCAAITGMRVMYQQDESTPEEENLRFQLGVPRSVKAARAPEVTRLARGLLSDPEEEVRSEAVRTIEACRLAVSWHNGMANEQALQ